jgi:hypothetical protein
MDSLARTDRIKKIAALNDTFRSSLAGGRVVVTAGVAALSHRTRVDALRAVQAFTAFTPDNDPYGEHDFGFFKLAGREFFWKIDAYDPLLTRHSDELVRQRQELPSPTTRRCVSTLTTSSSRMH